MTTAYTLTTTMTEAQKAAFYVSDFLTRFKEKVVLIPYAQRQPLPQNEGKVVNFFRYHNLTIVTSAHSEGDPDVTPEKLEAMDITATIQEYVKATDWSELHALTTRDKSFRENVVDIMSQNAAESLDWSLMKEVGKWGIYAQRADFNATYEADVTCHTDDYGSVSAGKLIATGLTETQTSGFSGGHWAGAWVTANRGKNYGECRRCTWFEESGDSDPTNSDPVLLFNGACWGTDTADATARGAWDEECDDATNEYMFIHACTPYDIHNNGDAITDGGGGTWSAYLNVNAVLRAAGTLDRNGAKRFANGKYTCILSYEQYMKLFQDGDWKTMNKETMRTGIVTGVVGEIGGVEFVVTSQAYKENQSTFLPATLPTTPVTTGVDMALVFGQNAFGAVDITGIGGAQDPRVGFKDTKSDTGDPAGQKDHAYWKAYFAYRPLNSNWCVGILCKAIL